jgi:hypothetical protein
MVPIDEGSVCPDRGGTGVGGPDRLEPAVDGAGGRGKPSGDSPFPLRIDFDSVPPARAGVPLRRGKDRWNPRIHRVQGAQGRGTASPGSAGAGSRASALRTSISGEFNAGTISARFHRWSRKPGSVHPVKASGPRWHLCVRSETEGALHPAPARSVSLHPRCRRPARCSPARKSGEAPPRSPLASRQPAVRWRLHIKRSRCQEARAPPPPAIHPRLTARGLQRPSRSSTSRAAAWLPWRPARSQSPGHRRQPPRFHPVRKSPKQGGRKAIPDDG